MTAKLLTDRNSTTDRAREGKRDGGAKTPASAVLPPVSTRLVDSLFHTESDRRGGEGSLRKAA